MNLYSSVKVRGHQEEEAKADDDDNGSDCHEFHVLTFEHFPLLWMSLSVLPVLPAAHGGHRPPYEELCEINGYFADNCIRAYTSLEERGKFPLKTIGRVPSE
jgi:hypothetical protein